MTAKKRLMIAAIAGAMTAALVVGGGSFAYLKDNSDTITNTFTTNIVTVDLTETTGNTYTIIPGTQQAKDPEVSVAATIPSYVYVKVVDQAPGLLTYAIADGWTELPSLGSSTAAASTRIYYREVDGTAIDYSFDVLRDNLVSYNAALENSDMLQADGMTLKNNQTLSFTAYAIQKEGFASPEAGYQGACV